MTRTARSNAGKAAAGLAISAALVLSGCAGQEPGTIDPNEEITLSISWWGNDERAAIMAEAIDLFEAKYENITVVEQPVGSPDDLFNRLATDFAGGGKTAPDLFALGGAKPQEYGALGALLDLSTVSDFVDTTKYADFTLTSAIVDGKLYGLPTGGNVLGAFINKDIFAQAGVDLPTEDWTWDDLVRIADEISAKTPSGIYGLDLRIQDILGTYVAQNTEFGIYDWDGKLATDASVVQKWFELEQRLVAGGGLPDPSVIVQYQNVESSQHLFAVGKAAITFGYSNLIGTYGAAGDVTIMAPPGEKPKSGVAVLPSQYWAINAASAHPEAAALLLDWLLNQPEAAKLIKANRGLPFNPDTLAVVEPLLSEGDALAAAYLQKALAAGTVAPPQPAGGQILNELSQRMSSDVLFGKATPAEAAAQWVAELSASLAKG